MKNWIIRKLGGIPRADVVRTQVVLRDMQGYADKNAFAARATGECFLYQGKQLAFGTAARCIGDILR